MGDPKPIRRHSGKNRPGDRTAAGLSGEYRAAVIHAAQLCAVKKASGALADVRDHIDQELSVRISA
jgi:hypothetical protein